MTDPSEVAARTARLGSADAGEILTLQLATWVREAQDNGTLDIPPLQETLADVTAALVDPRLTWWGHRAPGGRLLAMVRTSRPDARTGFVGRLGVVPDLRGTGLGSAMLRWSETTWPAEVEQVRLITGARSLSNHRFYARHGFVQVADPEGPAGTVSFAKDLRP